MTTESIRQTNTERVFMPFPMQDERLPFWSSSKCTDECNHCGTRITKGQKIWFYPAINGTWCETCGNKLQPIDPERME